MTGKPWGHRSNAGRAVVPLPFLEAKRHPIMGPPTAPKVQDWGPLGRTTARVIHLAMSGPIKLGPSWRGRFGLANRLRPLMSVFKNYFVGPYNVPHNVKYLCKTYP